MPGQRVVRVLEELKRRGRKPEAIVIDNGTEFTSQVMDQWAYENQVQLHFITPGRPMENDLERRASARKTLGKILLLLPRENLDLST
jgi:transposase InsO family protein